MVFHSGCTGSHCHQQCVDISLHPCLTVTLFNVNHPNRCWKICHCGSNLHFPNDKWCWTSFLYGYLLSIYLLYSNILPIFNCVVFLLSFWVFIYILARSPLLDMWFYFHIFSPSVFKEQTFLFLTKSGLVIYSFVDHACGVGCKKLQP